MTDQELDKLAAEKVMGWPADPLGGVPVRDWEPTRELSDAWMLVEKMGALGWYFGIYNFHVEGQSWRVEIMKGSAHYQREDESIARAITLAALRAVGTPEVSA
jgi:Phage ABA sandwich domain